ncbi:hypothetical protein FJN13_14560 [Alteromonas mediterranea]|uniref:hypothetical protein n=1 Tax=Alteromonas mediterranea TaxID=314275 RepID=UPI000C8CB3B5|nr:hypothetical protein [Alteromonas mediterranea]MAG66156.1 hypothetical protein [Pseudomonadales bacterium]QDG35956.1 hypothetical protein FJN13_14560 [Alteromonas mediterranea]|tara:strand:- start:5256 stop:6227 length:972 start_codon:yes stop_codon:yes gene_type:complete
METTENKEQVSEPFSTKLLQEIWLDTRNMARYAQSRGMKVEPYDIVTIQSIEKFLPDKNGNYCARLPSTDKASAVIADLTEVHYRLCQLIAPVVPEGTRYSVKTSTKWYNFLADAPAIVGSMLFVSLVFLILFVYIGGSEEVTAEVLDAGFLYRSPFENWLVGITYMTAAGLGACFYNLHAMYGYIVNRTYDPAYQSSYWVRLIIGIVSGFVLAEVFTIDVSGDLEFDKPLLAFLGGFSSDAVEAILRRLVEALVTLVKGRVKASEDKVAVENKARAEYTMKLLTVETLKKLNYEKQTLINDGADPDVIDAINKLISDVLKKI